MVQPNLVNQSRTPEDPSKVGCPTQQNWRNGSLCPRPSECQDHFQCPFSSKAGHRAGHQAVEPSKDSRDPARPVFFSIQVTSGRLTTSFSQGHRKHCSFAASSQTILSHVLRERGIPAKSVIAAFPSRCFNFFRMQVREPQGLSSFPYSWACSSLGMYFKGSMILRVVV